MKIQRLHLQNFRCYKKSVITFEPDLTVLIADNGVGKTSILDALAKGFGSLYKGFPGVKTSDLSLLDISISKGERQEDHCLLTYLAESEKRHLFWGRVKRRNSAASQELLKAMQDVAVREILEGPDEINGVLSPIREEHNEIMRAFNDGRDFKLPVIIYYGTERAVRSDVKRRRGFKHSFTRFDALAGALDAESSFRKALEWFNAMEEEERREKIKREDYKYEDSNLKAVRHAICELLPPKHSNPRVELKPVRFVIDQQLSDGAVRTLRLSQLSDGYRIVLAMTMDLARRLVEANPVDPNRKPFDVPSIVMIDEVDLHLHPAWQQNILSSLLKAFPFTQFIITTHSPQVLSTAPARSLRKISLGSDGIQIFSNYEFLSGARADYVLEDILGVEARPQNEDMVILFNRYRALLEEDLWDSKEALSIREKLNNWGRGFEPELEKFDVDIKVREFRRKR